MIFTIFMRCITDLIGFIKRLQYNLRYVNQVYVMIHGEVKLPSGQLPAVPLGFWTRAHLLKEYNEKLTIWRIRHFIWFHCTMLVEFALPVDRPFKNLGVNWCHEKPLDLFHLRNKSDPLRSNSDAQFPAMHSRGAPGRYWASTGKHYNFELQSTKESANE